MKRRYVGRGVRWPADRPLGRREPRHCENRRQRAEEVEQTEKGAARDAKLDPEPVPLHEQVSQAVAGHEWNENQMQLIRGQALFLVDSKSGHAGQRADPHRQNHPAKHCGLRSLERVEQRGKKHHGHDARAEVFKNVPRLTEEICRDFVAEVAGADAFHVEIDAAHPARFAVTDAIEYGINRHAARVTADNIIADQPWRVDGREGREQNQHRPSARTKEENAENQRAGKYPYRQCMR